MNTRNIIIIVIISALVLGYFAYSKLGFGGGTSTELVSSPVETVDGSPESAGSLEGLKSVSLDISIFSDPTFQSLTDFGVKIPQQTLGRVNPFAPISSVKNSSGSVYIPSVIKTSSSGVL